MRQINSWNNLMCSKIISLILFALLLNACLDDDRTTNIQDNIVESKDNKLSTDAEPFVAQFELSKEGNIIPFPNNLLFADSTDGTLNIPIEGDANDFTNPQVALNSLDGFSTTAPMSTTFSDALDASTIEAGESVRVFEVTLSGPGGAVTSIVSELSNTEFTATLASTDTNDSTLAIVPLKPLKAKTSYLVVITNQIKNQTGETVKADLMYEIVRSNKPLIVDGEIQFASFVDEEASDAENIATATKIETIRQLTNATETAVMAYTSANEAVTSLSQNDIILSWSFSTQSISDVLVKAKELAQASSPISKINNETVTTTLTAANIHVGSLQLPYYLSSPDTANPTAALSGFWQGMEKSFLTQHNTTPVATSTQTVPLLLAIPKAGKPEENYRYPVVIFQHGITSNRGALLALADTLASQGFAAVAIDLPLHGLHGDEDIVGGFRLATQEFDEMVAERHFDMDLVNNTTSTPGADGLPDDSGKHFINLNSTLTSRDNVRQSVADLFVLTKALESMDYDGGGPDFDKDNIYFVGHSLGGIVGATFLSLETNIKSAVLAAPGGGIAKLVDGSDTFGPIISAGLGANGIIKGTTAYESFMGAMQTALDSADPINYATQAVSNRGILMFELVGGNSAMADSVIPNSVAGSPLSGSNPLAKHMNLTEVNDSLTGTNLAAWIKFNSGHHSSLLTPNDAAGNEDASAAAVTTMMQTQMLEFLVSNGSSLTINDPDNVLAAP